MDKINTTVKLKKTKYLFDVSPNIFKDMVYEDVLNLKIKLTKKLVAKLV